MINGQSCCFCVSATISISRKALSYRVCCTTASNTPSALHKHRKDYYVYFQAYFLWNIFSLAVILRVFTMIWGIWFCGNMLFLIQNQYELLFQRLTSSFLQIKVRRVARLIVCRKHNADNNVPGAVYIWNSVPVANGFGSWYLLLEVPGMSATDENPYFFV